MKRTSNTNRPGKKSPMLKGIAPMLCTLTKTPVADPDYLHEVKWDGYRIISYVQKGKVQLDSRGAKDYTQRYPRVVAALQSVNRDVVIDGEMVVFNKDGQPDFDAL